MFLRAAHAGGEVLEAVHVKPAAAVTGWDYALAALELFHASDHFKLVRASVVFFLVGGFWRRKEGRWSVWDGDGVGRCRVVEAVVCRVGGTRPRECLGVDWGCCIVISTGVTVCRGEKLLHQVCASCWRCTFYRLAVDHGDIVGVGVGKHKLRGEGVLLGVLALGAMSIYREESR